MLIDQMSDRECRELLARTNLGRLACSFHDQPYVVPIHVDYFDGFLYCFSPLSFLAGTKSSQTSRNMQTRARLRNGCFNGIRTGGSRQPFLSAAFTSRALRFCSALSSVA
jgi:hypothetical protein